MILMSLFLFYFDDGPLDDLAGTRSSLTLRPIPQIVQYSGHTLTRSVVAITDGVASEALRDSSYTNGAAMRRDVALLVVERLLRSYSPRLLFHRARGESAAIQATAHVHLAIVDLCVRVARVDVAGRSGPQGHAFGRGQGPEVMTGAEGDVGNLGDVLAVLPLDTLIAVGAPPLARADRMGSAGKRGRR
jgi:hypothetical protein